MAPLPLVKQSDPHAGYLAYRDEIDSAVQRVLASDYYILGEEVALFEQEFSAHLEVAHAVGVANGTDALMLALMAVGVKEGDAVLTVSHTAVATVNAIVRCGAIPVFVEIDETSYTMSSGLLSKTLTSLNAATTPLNVAAIVVVHLYGQPAEMAALMSIAQEYQLPVIEDVAQAHGARYGNQYVGTFGDLAAYSFYPTKNLGALGDGGAVTTNSARYAEKVRQLRQYGWDENRISTEVGMNSRLDEIQAAILRVKLKHLKADNQRRQEIAKQYSSSLPTELTCSFNVGENDESVFHQYVIRTEKRDELRTYLASKNIQTAIHYETPAHLHPAYHAHYQLQQKLGLIEPLVKTEQIANEVLSLPLFPQLSSASVDRVIEACCEWSAQNDGE